MPENNNRKSREDKSFNTNRFDKSSKTERPEKTNTERRRKFDGDRQKPSSDRPGRSDRPASAERGDRKRTDDRPPFANRSTDSRERSRDFKAGGERSSDKRTFGSDRRSNSAGSRPQSDRPFEKKSYGADRKPYGADRKPFGADRKPYGDDRKAFGDDKRERRPLGDDRGPRATGSRPQSDRPYEKKSFGGDRKPYGDDRTSGSRPQSDRPYEKKSFGGDRKPYGGDRKPYGDDRKAFGDDKRERKPRTPGSATQYDRRPTEDRRPPSDRRPTERRSDNEENRKWTSEEHIEGSNLRVRKKPYSPSQPADSTIRLNRYIANAGICSRRKADELIEAGVITVNGEAINELGFKINPMTDVIRYNGETLKREKMTYVLLNKPKDYITTTDDPQERKTIMQLVDKASKERIYPIGRLDRNTTGLILLTNDGDLTDKLSHPRNNITKIYHVELDKSLSQGDMNKIDYGLELEDGLMKPDEISYVAGGSKKEIGIQIHSGKNRIVRRIFEHLGYEVVKLDRVVYANLTKKDLPRGRWRYLDEKEVIQLKHLIK